MSEGKVGNQSANQNDNNVSNDAWRGTFTLITPTTKKPARDTHKPLDLGNKNKE